MSAWRFWLCLVSANMVVVLSTNVWAEPNADVATLVRLDGQSVSATIKGIDAKGQITGDGLEDPLNSHVMSPNRLKTPRSVLNLLEAGFCGVAT